MNMPDLGPDGRPLQTSNPADEEPHVCAWCGKNAEDGVDVEVMDFEATGDDSGKYGEVRLCDKCNDYRIGEWPAEDTEQGLSGVCDALGIDNMLQPFVRGERAVMKVKALQAERDAYLDEVRMTNENEARIMADLLATREELDRLRAELDSLRAQGGEMPEWDVNKFANHIGIEGAFSAWDIRVFFAGAKACHEWIRANLRHAPPHPDTVEVPELTPEWCDAIWRECPRRSGTAPWESVMWVIQQDRERIRTIDPSRILKNGEVAVPETDVAMIRRCLDECAWDDVLQPIVDWTDRMSDAIRSKGGE